MPHQLVRSLLLSTSALAFAVHASAKDIVVSADQIQNMEIKLEQVRPAVTETLALLPGTVMPALNARVSATAPFPGTVVQVHVLPGQTVKKGDALANIASRELLEVQGRLAQAEAELQAATAIAERKRLLVDKKIANVTLANEAEAQVAKIRSVVEQHKAALSIGSVEPLDGGQYVIRSPAAGRLAHVDTMPGDPIAAMAAVVSVDTSEELWIDVQVPLLLAAQIKPRDRVQVIEGPEGVVVSVGQDIDKLTRSARLIATVPSNSGMLPGQMVKLTLKRTAQSGALQVPAGAVAWISGEHQVFTRTANGFSLKPVKVRGRTLETATISGDIAAGDMVAASGLPQLEVILGGN
jgi:membrane fusion protein, heavy metal efflux system